MVRSNFLCACCMSNMSSFIAFIWLKKICGWLGVWTGSGGDCFNCRTLVIMWWVGPRPTRTNLVGLGRTGETGSGWKWEDPTGISGLRMISAILLVVVGGGSMGKTSFVVNVEKWILSYDIYIIKGQSHRNIWKYIVYILLIIFMFWVNKE